MTRYDLRIVTAIGEPIEEQHNIDLAEFYAVNDLDASDVNAIGALRIGESHLLGGGAAPVFVIERVS